MKSQRMIKDHKSYYVNSEAKNDPIFIIFFGMQQAGKVYERNVYGLLDMLGNVGGLSEVIHTFSALLVYFTCQNMIDTKYISIFKNNILSSDSDKPLSNLED